MARNKSSDNRINSLMDSINKKLGSNLVTRASDIKLEPLKTGILNFDMLFNCGGIPRGDIIEIYGEDGTGKSSFCYQYSSTIQKNGGTVLYIDREGKFNINWAQSFGVDTDKLLLTSANTTEEVAKIIFEYAKTGIIDLIILDSLAAGGPETKPQKDDLDIMVGQNALFNNQFFRKWLAIQNGLSTMQRTAECDVKNAVLVVVNQLRESIELFSRKVRPGGRGKDYAAIARILITNESFIDANMNLVGTTSRSIKDASIIGLRTKLFIEKNQAGIPFKSAIFQFFFKENAFDNVDDFINYTLAKDIIIKSGKWYDASEIKQLIKPIKKDIKIDYELMDLSKIDGYSNLREIISGVLNEYKIEIK